MRLLVAAIFLFMTVPAAADVTGHYADSEGDVLVLEVDETGAGRIGAADETNYSLFTPDEGFIVTREGGRLTVIRWSDMMAVMDEQIAAIAAQAGIDVTSAAKEPVAAPAKRHLQPAGPVTVGGRTGISYITPDEETPQGHQIVVSEDPELAPLGLLWSRILVQTPSFSRAMSGKPADATTELAKLFETAAPLQIGDARLAEVSFGDIDEERFALPAEPISREEVRRILSKRD